MSVTETRRQRFESVVGDVADAIHRYALRRTDPDTAEHPALTAKEISEAMILYRQGWSTYQLGDRYQVDRSTVGKALRRAGLELRPSAGTRSRSRKAPG